MKTDIEKLSALLSGAKFYAPHPGINPVAYGLAAAAGLRTIDLSEAAAAEFNDKLGYLTELRPLLDCSICMEPKPKRPLLNLLNYVSHLHGAHHKTPAEIKAILEAKQ